MGRIRLIILSTLAVTAVSAAMAAAASAANHEYFIEGTAITASETVSGSSGTSKLVAPSLLTIECTADTFTGTIEPKGLSTATVKFTGCSVVGASTCKVKEPIEFTVNDKLTVFKFEPGDIFEPAAGKAFVTITITGCATLEGTYTAEGKQQCELPAAETNQLEHEFVCKPEGSELHLKTKPAEFTSKEEKVKLTGTNAGKKWSAKL